MKAIVRLFLGGFMINMVAFLFAPVMTVHAATNLITNPSAEQTNAAGTLPTNWQTDRWGKNTTTFSYVNSGYNSSKSLKVQMTSHSSGDAKWFFDPVSVSPSTDYSFTDVYQSNVTTSLVAMSLNSSNQPTYFDIAASVPASSSWKQQTFTVHTLATTKKLTILHLIKKVGWLQTDEMGLVAGTSTPPPPDPIPTPPPTPTPGNEIAIPNFSVEQPSSNASIPASWQQSSWGTNTPSYQYINGDGHDGTHSVKLTMSNYSSGDAKWLFNPITLPTNADYQFTTWYKSNTIPHAVVMYTKSDGSEDYFGLSDPQPPANSDTVWQQYHGIFNVPIGVQSVSVFMFLTNNGWLQTDDYHIATFQYTPFNRGIVTLTFDNGFEDNITTAIPVLDQYGFKTTYCYSTEYIEGQPSQVATVQAVTAHGHEVCSHSVHHEDLTLLNVATLDYELSHSKDYLQSITGQPVSKFITPFGAYNSTVLNEIKKYYVSNRNTDEGFNSKDNYDAYNLRVQNMDPTTTLAQFQGWVNKAKSDRTWLVIVYHAVHNTNLDTFDTKVADFKAQMAWLAGAGIPVERWDTALAEIHPQL